MQAKQYKDTHALGAYETHVNRAVLNYMCTAALAGFWLLLQAKNTASATRWLTNYVKRGHPEPAHCRLGEETDARRRGEATCLGDTAQTGLEPKCPNS